MSAPTSNGAGSNGIGFSETEKWDTERRAHQLDKSDLTGLEGQEAAVQDQEAENRGVPSGGQEAGNPNLAEALGQAARQVEDIARRLEMARSAAAGEEPELDELDRLAKGLGSEEEAQRRRTQKIAQGATEDLREVLWRLQQAVNPPAENC